jgi:hypothetical protein
MMISVRVIMEKKYKQHSSGFYSTSSQYSNLFYFTDALLLPERFTHNFRT